MDPNSPPVTPAELIDDIEDSDELPASEVEEASAPLLLTDEQRKALLGKLAEFELAVTSLAPKKQAFVLAYLADPTNATGACRKAGYSGSSISVRASKLLNEPPIAAAIALGQNLREDRTFITSDRTLHELAVIAYSNIQDFEVSAGGAIRVRDGVPEYAARAISSAEYTVTVTESEDRTTTTYKTKIRLWSKPEALRMLAMYQKLLSGEGGSNIILNDNRGQVHTHNYQKNTWQWGGRSINF